ncbi:MAG: hypothetical protein ACLR4Z_17810 [Butyricicoccaceae bacterium]
MPIAKKKAEEFRVASGCPRGPAKHSCLHSRFADWARKWLRPTSSRSLTSTPELTYVSLVEVI